MDSLSSGFGSLNLTNESLQIFGKEELDNNANFKAQVAQNFVIDSKIGYSLNIQDVKTLCFSVIEKKVEEYCQSIFKEIQERALKGHLDLKENFHGSDFESEIIHPYGKIKDVDRLICAYMREHYDITVKTFGEKIEFIWNEMNHYIYSKATVELPRLEENEFLTGFEKLRERNQYTDFTFIIHDSEKGAQERKVHKALFAIRIPCFEKPMEADNMHLESITIEAFDLFLNYVYGKKDIPFDLMYASLQAIESLLHFIENYPNLKLDKLRQICEWVLIEKLNQKTMNERDFKLISKMAKTYELKTLRNNCQLIELKRENTFLLEMNGMRTLQVSEQAKEEEVSKNLAMRRTKDKNARQNRPY
jgi:hypothetical protein